MEEVLRFWAEVDLDRIKKNVRQLKDEAGVPMMAVVKANGYGHGATEVSISALEAGATWLGVATVREGIELKEIEAPKLILSESAPTRSVGKLITKYGLTPVVYTKGFIDILPKGTNVHLKVDTGMHRNGCRPEEALSLARYIGSRGLFLQGLMTHFAVADDPDFYFTDYQMGIFEGVVAGIKSMGFDPIVHAANSAAVKNFPESNYDMVRCGISIYQGALTLIAKIGLIRVIPRGEGVSYGLHYRPQHDTRIAVIPLGYSHGIPRRLAYIGGEVIVNEKRCPIVSVTMDQTIIDLGPDVTTGALGTEVTLLGKGISPAEWAVKLDTIEYEILCGIRETVPRYY